MDGTFVEKLVEKTRPYLVNFSGVDYSNKSFSPIMAPVPDGLRVHTLGAVADYCENELVDGKRYVVHVLGPDQVFVRSDLSEHLRQRELLLSAGLSMKQFAFDQDHSHESFVIALQSLFVQDETTARILALVGNITAEASTTIEDDGVTQRVTAKAGIARTEEREVPNPVILRPFRTFTEIEQPESQFVLRIGAGGKSCALYEADGGAWKSEAILSIRSWLHARLEEQVTGGVVTILA